MSVTAHDAELHQRIDEILHYLWDPIGVAHVPDARDADDEGHLVQFIPRELLDIVPSVLPEELIVPGEF